MAEMKYMPLVSIVIPVYNGSNYMAEAIDSALSQTYENIEVILVNDGSRDDGKSDAIAKSYGDKIRYFPKENGGSSSALNKGIAEMKGEWFSWLSHDDLYYPDKVRKQVEYLNMLLSEGVSEADLYKQVLFTACDYINGEGKVIKKSKPEKEQALSAHIANLKGNEYLIAEPTKYNFYGCGCLVNKKVFEEIGAFDEKLRLINDLDMWSRVYMGSYKLHYMSEALTIGRIHSGQISRSIGFSYHNSEQDTLWGRSLGYLKENCPDNFEVFYLFGSNAYAKTRDKEGEEAFSFAQRIAPDKASLLLSTKRKLKLKAKIRSLMKKVYMTLFMR
ncbi:MAG: glycosyltransferase [Clostridia bacterium]|nr:glycosyltransferase [Clostridia bacterium]